MYKDIYIYTYLISVEFHWMLNHRISLPSWAGVSFSDSWGGSFSPWHHRCRSCQRMSAWWTWVCVSMSITWWPVPVRPSSRKHLRASEESWHPGFMFPEVQFLQLWKRFRMEQLSCQGWQPPMVAYITSYWIHTWGLRSMSNEYPWSLPQLSMIYRWQVAWAAVHLEKPLHWKCR